MRKCSYSHDLCMFHCLNTGKDNNHRCLKLTKKKIQLSEQSINGQTRRQTWIDLNTRLLQLENVPVGFRDLKLVLNKNCLRTYLWSSSFLQIQVRKRKCNCSHRQYMFRCFHKGWDNSRQYLIRRKVAYSSYD